MSTQLSNLIEKPGASLLKPRGSNAYSQIRVINLSFTGTQIAQAKTNAYVNVNFGVKCINVLNIICNTNGNTNAGSVNGYGLMFSNMVPNGNCLGVSYLNTESGVYGYGVKHYFRQPVMVNGNYDFWLVNSTGAAVTLQTGKVWEFTIIAEFISDQSKQMPVTSS